MYKSYVMDSDNNSSGESFPSNEHIEVSATQQQVVLFAGHNRWEWLLLFVAIINVIALSTSSGISLTHCAQPFVFCSNCFVLEMLICILTGISLLFALYGIFVERQFDIFQHPLWMVIALCLSWVSYTTSYADLHMLKLIINVSVTVLCLTSLLLAYKATHVPDWIEFQLIGVSDSLTAMYKDVCYFLAVLEFDSIFVFAFAVYSAEYSFNLDCNYWYAYQGLILLYAISTWQLGKMAVNKEDGFFVYAFYFASSCFSLLVTYQLYELSMEIYHHIQGPPLEQTELTMCESSIVFGICAFICKLYSMWNMKKAYNTFGNGLNSRSFRELVSRNSNNLLSHTRYALLF